jgi:cytochrome b
MTALRFVNGRIGAWLFFFVVLAAGFTRHGGGVWHAAFGIAAGFIAVARIVEGFVGDPAARFKSILHGTSALGATIRLFIRSKRGFSLKGVPLSGLCLVAVLSMTILTVFTGVLLTLDALWSSRGLSTAHALSSLLLFLSAAIYGSARIRTRTRNKGI